MGRTLFPAYQTYKASYGDDQTVHLIAEENWVGSLLTRCGWWIHVRSGVFSTQVRPECPECVAWLKDQHEQLWLRFPRGVRYIPRMDCEIPVWPEWKYERPEWYSKFKREEIPAWDL